MFKSEERDGKEGRADDNMQTMARSEEKEGRTIRRVGDREGSDREFEELKEQEGET